MKVAVGFFDGVHIGHRRILEGADVALTFRNHPLSLLAPERAPRLMQSAEDRLASIGECGVKSVVALDFTRELAAEEPEDFVRSRLLATCGNCPLVVKCGDNWRFGKGGRGDAKLLREMGVSVEIVPYAEYKGERVSSTRIRGTIESGCIDDANAMLGRRWTIGGRIAPGKGLGRDIGYPTLNLLPSALELRMPFGVYAVELRGARCVANYGLAPTAGANAWTEPVLEVHVLETGRAGVAPADFADGLRSAAGELKVGFVRFLRPERKFASFDELKSQIAADCAEAVRIR